MITKICPICNKEFQVIPCRENTAKYCSTNCRQESLKGELNCVCEYCGKKFHRKNYRKIRINTIRAVKSAVTS